MYAATLNRTNAVMNRVVKQLLKDRRFLILSVLAPILVIYLMYVFFDSSASPLFDPNTFIVPVGALIVHFITYILCAIVLVRERSQHTLTRMFVNGYQQIEIIGGYLLAYTILATLQTIIVLIEMNLLFELDYSAAAMVGIFVVVWLLAVISIAMGIFFSNFARNEGQVFPFIPMVIFPSVFVSGIIVAVDQLPDWAQILSRAIPLYYANEVLQELISGQGIGDAWGALLLLPIYGGVVLFLATLTLRELD